MFSHIHRALYTSTLLLFAFALLSLPLRSNAHETEWPGQKLAGIFPKADKFVQRSAVLTAAKIAAIEKELGAKLRAEDQKPIFYIALNKEKKPIGLVLFADAQGPRGVIEGAAGLDMKGKVVKVAVYEHNETDAIADPKFLAQFIGTGIDNAFKVGEDVEAADGQEDVANAVAIIPKKTLVMSYALFLKREPKQEPEKTPEPDTPEPDTPEEEDLPEVDDLKALMALMLDDYFVVVDYFDEKETQENAIAAAKQLANYAKLLSDFEPPKNADQTEEYTYLKDTFTEKLLKFAETLEEAGISDDTREQWDAIGTLIDQAHLRFSEAEIDLEAY